MIFTFITCPSNIYILLRNYFPLVMYISVGGWTRNTTMHAAATLGYIMFVQRMDKFNVNQELSLLRREAVFGPNEWNV